MSRRKEEIGNGKVDTLEEHDFFCIRNIRRRRKESVKCSMSKKEEFEMV